MIITGIVLAILLLLITLQGSFYYLVVRKARIIEWLFFNACSPANLAYLTGFIIYLITDDKTIIYSGILPMFFFGTLGMFVLPWKGMNIIPQIGHIIMTLNIIWIIVSTFIDSSFKSAANGLLLGILIFSVYISIQQNYVRNHQEDFRRILLQ